MEEKKVFVDGVFTEDENGKCEIKKKLNFFENMKLKAEVFQQKHPKIVKAAKVGSLAALAVGSAFVGYKIAEASDDEDEESFLIEDCADDLSDVIDDDEDSEDEEESEE